MRAYELTSFDGPAALRIVERADRGPARPGAVVLSVEAIGVNFPDLLITQGKYQMRPELPFTPGCEIAGTVLDAAPDSGYLPGDRAAGFLWHGGYAEQVEIDAASLLRLPDQVSSQVGAAMLINYHTAHFALHRRGRVRPGETVLVLGAAGGIGTAAIQVAKGLGCDRVIAGVATAAQSSAARDAGADEVVMLTEGFAQEVRALNSGRGVDVVVDPLGDWIFGEAIRALAPEGRILVIGFAAGAIPQLAVNRLLLKNVEAVGVAWGAFLDEDPGLLAETARTLTGMVADGAVRPLIGDVHRFEDLPLALESLSRGEILGKAVVDLTAAAR